MRLLGRLKTGEFMTPASGIISTARLPSDGEEMSKITTPTIQATFRSFAGSALELLFPIHCLECGRERDVICPSCVEELRRLEDPFCDICAQPGAQGQCDACLEHPSAIDGIRAPYLFEEPLLE